MKTSNKIIILLAAIGLPTAAFAAFSTPSAANGEIAFAVLPIIGLQFAALLDAGRRRIIARKAVAASAAARPATVRAFRPSYGLRRHGCPAA